MAFNQYVSSLITLRNDLINKIDGEIEAWMRGRANSDNLKDGLLYVIEESSALKGLYKEWEVKNV